jgi:hypothetical protein
VIEILDNASDVFHDPAALLRMGASLERFGDTSAASGYYRKLLELSYVEPGQRSVALQRLAAHADSVAELLDLSRRVLEEDPDNLRAKNALECLTPAMQARIEADPTGLLREAFRTPLNVQVQTISRCNARCVMCPYPTSWHATHPGRMSDECFERVVDLLDGMPLGRVCLYLENEPFLDPALIERLDIVKTRLRFEQIELSTNVSALTEAKAAALIERLADVPHELWISWHGTTAETYEAVMGLDFEKSLARCERSCV